MMSEDHSNIDGLQLDWEETMMESDDEDYMSLVNDVLEMQLFSKDEGGRMLEALNIENEKEQRQNPTNKPTHDKDNHNEECRKSLENKGDQPIQLMENDKQSLENKGDHPEINPESDVNKPTSDPTSKSEQKSKTSDSPTKTNKLTRKAKRLQELIKRTKKLTGFPTSDYDNTKEPNNEKTRRSRRIKKLIQEKVNPTSNPTNENKLDEHKNDENDKLDEREIVETKTEEKPDKKVHPTNDPTSDKEDLDSEKKRYVKKDIISVLHPDYEGDFELLDEAKIIQIQRESGLSRTHEIKLNKQGKIVFPKEHIVQLIISVHVQNVHGSLADDLFELSKFKVLGMTRDDVEKQLRVVWVSWMKLSCTT